MLRSSALLTFFVASLPLGAQSISLSLGSATGVPGAQVSVPLTLTRLSGPEPQSLQWTLNPPAGAAIVSIAAGPSASAAGKTLVCNGPRCLVYGLNTNTIPNGVVATVTLRLGLTAGLFPVGLLNSLAANLNALVTAAASGTVTAQPQTPTDPPPAPEPTPVRLSGLTCGVASLRTPGTTSCTATLSGAAPAAGFPIDLTSDNPALVVPPRVNVTAGQTWVGFGVSASAVASDRSVTVRAAAGTDSRTASLLLLAAPTPVRVTSLSCTPAVLQSSQVASCTVQLNAPAPAATAVALSDTSSALATPAGVTIPNGQTSTTFSITAGSVSSSQAVSVSAALNGETVTTQVSLAVTVSLSSLTCSPAMVSAGGSSLCTVAVSAPVSSTANVAISVSSDTISSPLSVTIASGSTSSQFRVNVSTAALPQQATITASYQGLTQTAPLTVTGGNTPQLTSLSCPPNLLLGESGACTVSVAGNSTQALAISLSSTNPLLAVPATLAIPAGSGSQTFAVNAVPVAGTILTAPVTTTVIAAYSGQTVSAPVQVLPPATEFSIQSLTCSATVLASQGSAVCVAMFSSLASGPLLAAIGTDDPVLQVPPEVAIPAGSGSITFPITAGQVLEETFVLLTVSLPATGKTASRSIQITPGAVSLSAPSAVFGRAGDQISFEVQATDGSGSPVMVVASHLPSGAAWSGGRFTWSPEDGQTGEFLIPFEAGQSSGGAQRATVRLVVRRSYPVIEGLYNPAGYTPVSACSPLALMTLVGSGFSLHDPVQAAETPLATELAGVRVRINDSYAPLTFVSDTTVHFQCPESAPGSDLRIALEYERAPRTLNGLAAASVAATIPLSVRSATASPGIYLAGGNQGAVVVSGTGMVAGRPQPGYAARPAHRGEYVEVYANGMGGVSKPLGPGQSAPLDELIFLTGEIHAVLGDGQRLPVVFAGLAPGTVGLVQINVQLPQDVISGDAVPLYLELEEKNGTIWRSNTVTIAISPDARL